MNATVKSEVVATVSVSAGDAAVKAAAVKGVNNATLLKAVWSTRGPIRVAVPGFDFGVAIIKSDLTALLKALPAADAATFTLVPAGDGADLIAA